VKRVVHIEPYAKSQALDLHDAAIVIDDHGDSCSRSDREEECVRAAKKVVFMGSGREGSLRIDMQAPTSTARPTDNLNLHCTRYSSCVECDHKSRVAKTGKSVSYRHAVPPTSPRQQPAGRALASPDVTEAEVNRDDQ
jgi:hypothetical protein